MSETDLTKKEVGNLGEDIACRFLCGKGHSIKDRNYWKKWGEIDVVSVKDKVLHFTEVKTVQRNLEDGEGSTSDNYRPEDNVHPWKIQRLSRVIQTYILEKNITEKTEWKFNVVVVLLDVKSRRAKVRFLSDLVLS